MATSLLTIIVTAASLGGGGLSGAQDGYMRCLDTELDAAVSRRIDGASFATGIAKVCEEETATYRRVAVASILGQGAAGGPAAANARFDTFDRENRAELVSTFEQRMKLRRGPARISGLTVDRRTQHD